MTVLERVNRFLGDKDEGMAASFWPIIGPLFVLCAYSVSPDDLLILLVGVLGLVLSARWQIRGFSYALVLLGAVAVFEHLFFTSSHLWQLGLEGSCAIAFFITALSSEQGASFFQSLSSQIDMQRASVKNLEEDLTKSREEISSQQVVWQDKIDSLKRELEEGGAELSSLLILNEVLRKTAARDLQEKADVQEALQDAQQREAVLRGELEEKAREVSRLANGEALAIENRELTNHLNAARLDKEQARLIGETLARLHAKETLKSSALAEKVDAVQEENQRALSEVAAVNAHLEKMGAEREQHRAVCQQLDEMQAQRNFLQERLEQAEIEREQHRAVCQKLDEMQAQRNFLQERLEQIESERTQSPVSPVLPEEFTHLQERVKALAPVEILYKQLRAQFEEKNAVLHQTRVELFHADTQLQTLKMEKAQRELQPEQGDPIVEEMRRELSLLEEELSGLGKENEALQDLITHLTENAASQQKKK